MSQNREFFELINETFARGDLDFLLEHVADDIEMKETGYAVIRGKEAFTQKMEPMRGVIPEEYHTTRIIIHGLHAVIEGTMKMFDSAGELKTYAFCDIYTLDKHNDGKIKELTTYVIEV